VLEATRVYEFIPQRTFLLSFSSPLGCIFICIFPSCFFPCCHSSEIVPFGLGLSGTLPLTDSFPLPPIKRNRFPPFFSRVIAKSQRSSFMGFCTTHGTVTRAPSDCPLVLVANATSPFLHPASFLYPVSPPNLHCPLFPFSPLAPLFFFFTPFLGLHGTCASHQVRYSPSSFPPLSRSPRRCGH